jgi:elongation factor P
MAYQTSDIRNGLKIELEGYPYEVVYFQFVKPGKGTAFTRVKMKNLLTGNVLERTYRTGETLEPADVETVTMQYLYKDGDTFYFMNQENFEQIPVPESVVGDRKNFLLDEAMCQVMLYKGRPVNIEVPTFVELEVTYTEPGARGNSASGGTTKQATLHTGAVVNVPLFIEQGEWLRVDTRTGEYVERVKK